MSSLTKLVDSLENNHPYITAILISIAIIMWFRGVVGLIDIIFVREQSLANYVLLMLLSLIILYILRVGIDVIFDIKQRRRVNHLLKKEDELVEEDVNDLESVIHHTNTADKHNLVSTTLYPALHSF